MQNRDVPAVVAAAVAAAAAAVAPADAAAEVWWYREANFWGLQMLTKVVGNSVRTYTTTCFRFVFSNGSSWTSLHGDCMMIRRSMTGRPTTSVLTNEQ